MKEQCHLCLFLGLPCMAMKSLFFTLQPVDAEILYCNLCYTDNGTWYLETWNLQNTRVRQEEERTW